MRVKFILTNLLFTLLSLNSFSQTDKQEIKDNDYYFGIIDDNMIKELIKKNVLSDSLWVTSKYLDRETKNFNKEGSKIFKKIQIKEHLAYFKDYIFLQHVEYKNHIYALFFTMEGIRKGISKGTLVWSIIKFEKENWKPIKRLKKNKLNKKKTSFELILSSQEKTPSLFFDPNEKILIKNDHLIFEKGNLFFSLYDLQTNKIIIHEIKPWILADKDTKEGRIEWIKTNLHEKILNYLDKLKE